MEVDQSGQVRVVNSNEAIQKLRFLREMILSTIDTYLIVAHTLYTMMELGVTIDQDKITQELHSAIK